MRHALPFLAVLVLLVGACAPVAGGAAGLIENNDGAALTYVLADQPGGPGLAYDPGPALARGVIIRAEGDDLQLLSVPEGATCTVTTSTLDCRLGDLDVGATSFVGLTGGGVVANATWRRAGGSTVYLTFAQLPEPEIELQEGGQ